MLSAVRQLAWMFLRCLLPCPDLLRRARVRRAARRLITCDPWPERKATGADVAQLALLRLLWLQEQVRHAVILRQREASAVLARSALEVCITGLWGLRNPDAARELGGGDAAAAPRILAFLASAGLVSEATIKAAADALDTGARPRSIKAMAEQLESKHGSSDAISLYRKYYAPLSHFFNHASSFALLRHAYPAARLRNKPAHAWARRGPVRLADGCTGLLAAAIAGESGTGTFTRYSDAHLSRALVPLGAVGGSAIRHSGDWKHFPEIYGIVSELQAYANGSGLADDNVTREARISEGLAHAHGLLHLDETATAFLPHFVGDLTATVLTYMDSLAEPGKTDPSEP